MLAGVGLSFGAELLVATAVEVAVLLEVSAGVLFVIIVGLTKRGIGVSLLCRLVGVCVSVVLDGRADACGCACGCVRDAAADKSFRLDGNEAAISTFPFTGMAETNV